MGEGLTSLPNGVGARNSQDLAFSGANFREEKGGDNDSPQRIRSSVLGPELHIRYRGKDGKYSYSKWGKCLGRQENLIFSIEDEALERDIGIILARG